MSSAILPTQSKMEQAIARASLWFSKQLRAMLCSKSHSLIHLRLLSQQMFPIRDQGPFSSVATQRAIAYLSRVTISYFQLYLHGAVWWLCCDFASQERLQASD